MPSYITRVPKIAIHWAHIFAGSTFLKEERKMASQADVDAVSFGVQSSCLPCNLTSFCSL